MIREFTDLITWKQAHVLVLEIYSVTIHFPSSERFGITQQMRRSAVSITSNIAEGFGRFSYKEKVRFYYISSGSLSELQNQLIIARDLHYLESNIYIDLEKKMNSVYKLLRGLIERSKQYVNDD